VAVNQNIRKSENKNHKIKKSKNKKIKTRDTPVFYS
jgi:hypothetical protein